MNPIERQISGAPSRTIFPISSLCQGHAPIMLHQSHRLCKSLVSYPVFVTMRMTAPCSLSLKIR